MNKLSLRIVELCPLLSLLFSSATIIVTTTIGNGVSLLFLYFCAQVYLNWFSISRISRAAATVVVPNDNRFDVRIQINDQQATKLWYCEKCTAYTSRPSRHCVLCKKCFHYRDHHCFFLGGCIIRQNMGNFILICLYTSLSSIYALSVLGPHLYDHLDHFLSNKSTVFDVMINFSFPIALARFLFSEKESCIVLVTLFDALFSVSCICSTYGVWKLVACLTGRQRYFPHGRKTHDIAEVFGSYGLCNLIFPINGLIGAKAIAQQDQRWKEI